MSPKVPGTCPCSELCSSLSTSMFWMLPNSAGRLPAMLLNERSSHVRLASSPTPVQLVMSPVRLLSRSVIAVTRPKAHEAPSR